MLSCHVIYMLRGSPCILHGHSLLQLRACYPFTFHLHTFIPNIRHDGYTFYMEIVHMEFELSHAIMRSMMQREWNLFLPV